MKTPESPCIAIPLAQSPLAARRSLSGEGVKPDYVPGAQPAADPWLGWTELVAHPAAPAGGGGPGFFRSANPMGTDGDFGTLVSNPQSPAARLVDPIVLQDKAETLADPPALPAPELKKDETKTVGGISVLIKKDEQNVTGVTDADTKLNLKTGVPGRDVDEKGIVTKINGNSAITGTISTKYAKGSAPNDLSAYGRGTTKADKAAGNITLGFHESCHRQDFQTYLTTNSVPTFGGKVGMTGTAFDEAGVKYLAAVDAYLDAALAKSEADTDEVGNPARSAFFSTP